MNNNQATSQIELIDAINTAGVIALINQKFIEHANDETKAEVITDERVADVGGQTRVRLHRPVEQISETVILGTGPEAAPAVVDLLEELGVLP